MNIILVTPLYPLVNRHDLVFDTKAIHYFTRQWVKAGHNVTVFHMYFHLTRKYKLYYGRRITKTELDGVKIYMMENRCSRRLKKITKAQMIIAANNYNKLIPNIQTPDVLLVHMPCDMVGFIENLNIRCPRIAVLHETDIKRLNNKMADISDLINNYVGIGFRSMSIKNRFCGLTPSDIDEFIVYSGAPSLAPQKEIRNEYNKCLQILFVGKLIPRKNVHVVLRSLASVSDKLDFHFTIVGEGKEKPYLESLTQSLELNAKVSFYSAMAREDVLKKMDEVDVFVMVSSSETFGLVYIEAMSRGCITIGAKGEGIDGVIIDGENGFLVEPDNIIMLQKCIIKIANMNHRERVSMSKKAVCTAQNMSEEKVADDYLNNVKKLLAHD